MKNNFGLKQQNADLLYNNKEKVSNYNREYYQKNREKLKLIARELYRRKKRNAFKQKKLSLLRILKLF